MEETRRDYKVWAIGTVILMVISIVVVCAFTITIDPFFHYHKPINEWGYLLHNERYQNDRILKHFDYDAMITGTSMTQNFKTSEMDAIFGVHSVKTPFSGGSYKEINKSVETAVKANSELKCIIRGLDYGVLLEDKDMDKYEGYPYYLYDNVYWNDVFYLLNKEVMINESFGVLLRMIKKIPMTSFDEYSNWMRGYKFGRDAVNKTYIHSMIKSDELVQLTEADIERLRANIVQNVTSVAEQNPDITFYYFFTPYSIYYWDSLNQSGTIKRQLDAEKIVIEMLLQYENIRLFSFYDEFDMICDLNNYKDILHYSEQINSKILRWMYEGKHLLTKDNYEEYCHASRDYYLNFDYDSLFTD